MILLTYIISIFSLAGAFAPLIPSRYWLVKSQVYIKGFYAFTSMCALVLIFIHLGVVMQVVLGILLLAAITYCVKPLIPFTRIYKTEIKKCEKHKDAVSILICNVYQDNDKYEELIKVIDSKDPDIVFLVETDDKWEKGLQKLEAKFEFHKHEVRDNTYGLMFYSKFEPIVLKVNHLVREDVPSIQFKCEWHGKFINIVGIHPRPPILGESDYSIQKDAELLMASKVLNEIDDNEYKILLGDLNDVAWSNASQAFKKKTQLKDPRV